MKFVVTIAGSSMLRAQSRFSAKSWIFGEGEVQNIDVVMGHGRRSSRPAGICLGWPAGGIRIPAMPSTGNTACKMCRNIAGPSKL